MGLTFENIYLFCVIVLLEIVLGIDNLVFISLIVESAEKKSRGIVKGIGLSLGFLFRVAMLFGVYCLISLEKIRFSVFGLADFSVRDLVFIAGGCFLVYKGGSEIFRTSFVSNKQPKVAFTKAYCSNLYFLIAQVTIVDFVFSVDSVLSALAITTDLLVVIPAFAISLLLLYFCIGPTGKIIEKFVGIKIICLLFIIIVGLMLICDGFNVGFEHKYAYFALMFSLFAEFFRIQNANRTQLS